MNFWQISYNWPLIWFWIVIIWNGTYLHFFSKNINTITLNVRMLLFEIIFCLIGLNSVYFHFAFLKEKEKKLSHRSSWISFFWVWCLLRLASLHYDFWVLVIDTFSLRLILEKLTTVALLIQNLQIYLVFFYFVVLRGLILIFSTHHGFVSILFLFSNFHLLTTHFIVLRLK